jgi:hypothetical protein
MSKIAAAILFAMVTVLTGSAHATTLTVTGGSIGLTEQDFEPGVDLTGEGWSLFGWSTRSCCAFGPGSETFEFHVQTLTLGDTTFTTPCCEHNSDIAIVRASAPPEPPCGEFGICEPWSAAFTMTGHVGGFSGVDLVGQGVVTHELLRVPEIEPPFGIYYLHYDFAPARVPEPPTLLLAVAGLCALGALFRARFARDR